MRILFIEDDRAFRDELTEYLVTNGLDVDVFDHFGVLAAALERHAAHLVLLNLKVGGQDGMAFLRDELRHHRSPCVILTASDDEAQRVLGLELGADDVIHKTTRPREILARLRAVIRRSLFTAGAGTLPPGWRFLPQKRDLLRPDGSSVPLTTAEFNLLAALVRNQGQPMSREELFGLVFGRPFNPLDRAIDNVVAKLRAKLGGPVMIRTVRPVGYAFTGFPDAEYGEDG